MRDANSPSVLGIGCAVLDVLAHVDEALLASVGGIKGGTEQIDAKRSAELLRRLPQQPSVKPGGAAANTVIGLGQLGTAAGFLGKLGKDSEGELFRRNLKASHVRTDALKEDPQLPTGHCISLITPDSERTMRTFMGASETLTPEDLTKEDFRGYSHCLMEGYMLRNLPLVLAILQLAKAADLTICMDLSAPEIVKKSQHILPQLLIDFVDVIFANELEATALTGLTEPEASLRAMTEFCSLPVVKRGREGALIWDAQQQRPVAVPAVDVKAVDTTGAGDLWAAGFLHASLNGATLYEAGCFGGHVAAEVVQVTGTTIPPERWETLRQMDPTIHR